MTREELITLGQHKVRSNEHLMLSYLIEFEKLFGRKPNCAGCTFKSDWKRFSQTEKIKTNTYTMAKDKTFELNNSAKNKIHTYRIGTSPRRSYGYKFTEEFAIAYLTEGTKEEIKARKKHFTKLPTVKQKKEPIVKPEIFAYEIELDGETILLADAIGRQLNAYAEANGIYFGDATRVADKKEVIAKTLK